MRVKEEFLFEDIKEYLDNSITLVIANASQEERKNKMYEEYLHKINVVSITFCNNNFILTNPSDRVPVSKTATYDTLGRVLLSFPNVNVRNVLIDITSLQHVVIACLLKKILGEIKPARVFLSYVKPENYIREGIQSYDFSKDFSAPAAIPGFASCSKKDEILVPFLGFEGIRLKNIIDDEHYSDINPIVGFPSDDPMWQFETLRYCKDAIVEQGAQLKIRKCKADSIYDAYYELEKIAEDYNNKPLVIAPLGTRSHFVASVIYSLKHKRESRIIYDNAVEKSCYTNGIRNIKIYHISRFIGE